MEIEPTKPIESYFYIFSPVKLGTEIFFKNETTLKEEVTAVLLNRKYPLWVIKIRTLKLCTKLFSFFLKRKKLTPNNEVYLIYEGNDSTLFFCQKEDKRYVLREENNGKISKEDFKGLPIHYHFNGRKIQNRQQIIRIIKNHLKSLKSGNVKTHGDFTVYNILINNKNEISFIDRRENSSKSILSDHFYFFTYFLIRIKRHNRFNIIKQKSLEKELIEVFRLVFKDEDQSILKEIANITIEDIVIPKGKKKFNTYFMKFKEMMYEIIE